MTGALILQQRLGNPELLVEKARVGGNWISPEEGSAQRGTRGYFVLRDPATGDIIAHLPDLPLRDVQEAIQCAVEAQSDWARRTAKERSVLLRRWYDLILTYQEDLACLITGEAGKPLSEARTEVAYGASFIEWFSEEAKRIYGDVLPAHKPGLQLFVFKEPIGVAGALTPWNFPHAMVTRKIAPALAAGCTVVLKPSSLTPLSATALAFLASEAGIPPGVLNVVLVQDAAALGSEFCTNQRIRKISFTGSTSVGRQLMAQCAPQVKRLSLELGGNAPFIVFEDADLDAAVDGLIAGKFRNAGQTCVCPNRIYVQDSIYQGFAEKFCARVSQLKVGSGFEKDVALGPLISARALEKVQQHVVDAQEKGAQCLYGGTRHALGGNFFCPTVLTEVNATMLCAKEETFGPVAPLFRFRTTEEVLTQANATEAGLVAYFYTQSSARFFAVTRGLQYGMVGLNTGMVSTELAPFGGIKQSGFGREGSKYGIESYVNLKYLCWGSP